MKVDTQKLIKNNEYCLKVFKHYVKVKALRKSGLALYEKHLNKALRNLEFANFILAEHDYSIKEKLPKRTFYDWCITIYYYAIYHAALALVEKIGYESKNHLATITAITLFYYHHENILKREDVEFIIEKISLDQKDITLVTDSKELRERACYGADEVFEAAQAKKLGAGTADFVNKIRALLKS